MKLLIDMSLPPRWCAALEGHGFSCTHWSVVGGPRVADATLLGWALENGRVVVTHDLDVGAVLAATRGRGPSVVQLRTQDVLPPASEALLVEVLQRHQAELGSGAILVANGASVRILPLAR